MNIILIGPLNVITLSIFVITVSTFPLKVARGKEKGKQPAFQGFAFNALVLCGATRRDSPMGCGLAYSLSAVCSHYFEYSGVKTISMSLCMRASRGHH